MVFIGFGMLFTLLKHHNWSSIAINLFVAVITIEFAFFSYYFWSNTFSGKNWERKPLSFETLIFKEFNAVTVLITLGTVIGKLSIPQYFTIALIESFTSSFNYFLCRDKLDAIDTGGSMYVYLFGGITGIILSLILFRNEREIRKILTNKHKSTNYISAILAFIGTLFIWMLVPSFNSSLVKSKNKDLVFASRYRAIVNTYLSMCGSVLGSFSINTNSANVKRLLCRRSINWGLF